MKNIDTNLKLEKDTKEITGRNRGKVKIKHHWVNYWLSLKRVNMRCK